MVLAQNRRRSRAHLRGRHRRAAPGYGANVLDIPSPSFGQLTGGNNSAFFAFRVLLRGVVRTNAGTASLCTLAMLVVCESLTAVEP